MWPKARPCFVPRARLGARVETDPPRLDRDIFALQVLPGVATMHEQERKNRRGCIAQHFGLVGVNAELGHSEDRGRRHGSALHRLDCKAIFFCIPAAQKLDVVSYSGLGQTRVRVSLVDSRHIRVQ